MRTLILSLLSTLILGCGAGGYTAQMAEQAVTTTAMPVATPLSRDLVLVLSQDTFPSDFQIENSRHSLAGFRPFVGQSLQQAMAPYFNDVQVASSVAEAPATPHYIAEVKLTRVAAKPITAGGLTYTTIVMEWSLGLRPSEADEYVFSLVAESPSDPQYRTLDDGAKQMMKAAINGLLSQWTEKDVYTHLRTFEAGPPPTTTEPAATTEEI